MEKPRCTAIILAAGNGIRMRAEVFKQYLKLCGKPVLYYSLMAFQKSDVIDDIILVAAAGDTGYCRREIVEKYGITKVRAVVEGGKERYDSANIGLKLISDEGYVFIHDAARPFVDSAIIERAYEKVKKTKACIAGVPAKDTIKIADEQGWVEQTTDRDRTWIVQTPQVFENSIIKEAYKKLMSSPREGITDDSMAVELMTDFPVALVKGSYDNIKITTPEDFEAARVIAKMKYDR